jgi:hypothetical protein
MYVSRYGGSTLRLLEIESDTAHGFGTCPDGDMEGLPQTLARSRCEFAEERDRLDSRFFPSLILTPSSTA